MLTVITPATSKRLTTVSAVREHLELADDSPSDETIGMWIDAASQAIVDYCGREFAQQTYRETLFAGNCARGYPVLLEATPVTEIISTSYAGSAVLPADFILDRDYLWRKSAAGRPLFWGPSELVVDYKAGYILPADPVPTVTPPDLMLPATVQLACLGEIKAQRSRAARSDPFVRSESEEGVGSTSWQVGSVAGGGALAHPESAGYLARYKMVRVR